MKYFLTKIKSEKGESEVTDTLLIEADTYATAEQVGYAWAEENCTGSFTVDSVIKSQIKEVYDVWHNHLSFFLIKYEFGLEAKPEKSNLVTTGENLSHAYEKSFGFLEGKTDALVIPEAKKMDITEYLDYAQVKEFLKLEDEEPEEQETVEEEDFSL